MYIIINSFITSNNHTKSKALEAKKKELNFRPVCGDNQ